jgi:ATP-binding cassette, subfamily B (MDR/TAP), member 1
LSNAQPPLRLCHPAAFYKDNAEEETNKYVLIMLYIAIASFVCGTLEVACTKLSGSRQAARIKQAYLQSLLYQDMTFFDIQSAHGQLMKGLNYDIAAFQEAISERLGAFVHNLAVFVVGLAIGP